MQQFVGSLDTLSLALALSMLPGGIPAHTEVTVAPAKQALQGSANWAQDKDTSGWDLMSVAERNEHSNRIKSIKNYAVCRTYMDQHHAKMTARAMEHGPKTLQKPSHDACARLKP